MSANVISSCTVTNGTLAFGDYAPTATGNLDQTGTFTVACTKSTGATVGLGLVLRPNETSTSLGSPASHRKWRSRAAATIAPDRAAWRPWVGRGVAVSRVWV